MEIDRSVTTKFIVSDSLPRWDKVGRVHEVLLRVGIAGTTELDRIRFSLNGKQLPESILRKINQMYRMSGPRKPIRSYILVHLSTRSGALAPARRK